MLMLIILIMLHRPNGDVVEINRDQVTSLRGRHEAGDLHFPEKARCLINMTDGKYVVVTETCKEVHKLLNEAAK